MFGEVQFIIRTVLHVREVKYMQKNLDTIYREAFFQIIFIFLHSMVHIYIVNTSNSDICIHTMNVYQLQGRP